MWNFWNAELEIYPIGSKELPAMLKQGTVVIIGMFCDYTSGSCVEDGGKEGQGQEHQLGGDHNSLGHGLPSKLTW